ncbi:MAG: hypothetical protein KDC54_22230 [Lewinella sp.]|nr:hypothetical protein [Lewinella sp.]
MPTEPAFFTHHLIDQVRQGIISAYSTVDSALLSSLERKLVLSRADSMLVRPAGSQVDQLLIKDRFAVGNIKKYRVRHVLYYDELIGQFGCSLIDLTPMYEESDGQLTPLFTIRGGDIQFEIFNSIHLNLPRFRWISESYRDIPMESIEVTRQTGPSFETLLREQFTQNDNRHILPAGTTYGDEPLSPADRAALLRPSVDTLTTYDVVTFEPAVSITEQPPAIDQPPAWLRLRLIWLWDQQTHTLNLFLKGMTPYVIKRIGNRSFSEPLFNLGY